MKAAKLLWIDTNNTIPEDRYAKQDWAPLADTLKLVEEPKWYLNLVS
jgi:hypothetical protein